MVGLYQNHMGGIALTFQKAVVDSVLFVHGGIDHRASVLLAVEQLRRRESLKIPGAAVVDTLGAEMIVSVGGGPVDNIITGFSVKDDIRRP